MSSAPNLTTLSNSTSEIGGTTDGASTPLVAPASTEFEFHFTPTTITSAYGPYCGIVPSTYSGNNNCYTATEAITTTGAMTYVGGTSGTIGLRYNASGTYSQVGTTNYNGTACKLVRNSSNYLEFYSNLYSYEL